MSNKIEISINELYSSRMKEIGKFSIHPKYINFHINSAYIYSIYIYFLSINPKLIYITSSEISLKPSSLHKIIFLGTTCDVCV